MRIPRLRFLTAAAVAAGFAMILGAASAAAAPIPPRAQVVALACVRATTPAQRLVAVRAIMRPIAGTRAMAVRFELLERLATGSSEAVRGPGLGAWVTPSNPTLGQRPGDVWRLDKTVINLGAAAYHFRVTFRWMGADGRVLQTTTRSSPGCREPEARADLEVQSLSVTHRPGDPYQDLYVAVIGNLGPGGAGPFEVVFEPGGLAPTIDSVAFLPAGQTRRISFVGSACSALSPPVVAVVPGLEIIDPNLANNALTATCPPG